MRAREIETGQVETHKSAWIPLGTAVAKRPGDGRACECEVNAVRGSAPAQAQRSEILTVTHHPSDLERAQTEDGAGRGGLRAAATTETEKTHEIPEVELRKTSLDGHPGGGQDRTPSPEDHGPVPRTAGRGSAERPATEATVSEAEANLPRVRPGDENERASGGPGLAERSVKADTHALQARAPDEPVVPAGSEGSGKTPARLPRDPGGSGFTAQGSDDGRGRKAPRGVEGFHAAGERSAQVEGSPEPTTVEGRRDHTPRDKDETTRQGGE
jgi:hypothetical protein